MIMNFYFYYRKNNLNNEYLVIDFKSNNASSLSTSIF